MHSKLARMQLRREHQNLQEFHNNYDDIEVALGGPTRSRDTGMFNCLELFAPRRVLLLQTTKASTIHCLTTRPRVRC